jgi:hypothetical protein
MMPIRKFVFRTLGILALVLFATAGHPSLPTVGCLAGEVGCGQGSNLCKYDCPGTFNCVRSGNPFEMCSCSGGECVTSGCPM